MTFANMAELIDAAAVEAGDVPSAWSAADTPTVARLLRLLRMTGPLYHAGRVYFAGEGESYEIGVGVIDDVRVASEVACPAEA